MLYTFTWACTPHMTVRNMFPLAEQEGICDRENSNQRKGILNQKYYRRGHPTITGVHHLDAIYPKINQPLHPFYLSSPLCLQMVSLILQKLPQMVQYNSRKDPYSALGWDLPVFTHRLCKSQSSSLCARHLQQHPLQTSSSASRCM